MTPEGTVLAEAQQAEANAGTLLPGDCTDLNPSWGWAAGVGISTVDDLATSHLCRGARGRRSAQ
jgi:D-alanyl-D-alanine carboxypeptidase